MLQGFSCLDVPACRFRLAVQFWVFRRVKFFVFFFFLILSFTVKRLGLFLYPTGSCFFVFIVFGLFSWSTKC